MGFVSGFWVFLQIEDEKMKETIMEGDLLITKDSQIESIQRIIYEIRGQKVMLDSQNTGL